jgi:hypothetical protein
MSGLDEAPGRCVASVEIVDEESPRSGAWNVFIDEDDLARPVDGVAKPPVVNVVGEKDKPSK